MNDLRSLSTCAFAHVRNAPRRITTGYLSGAVDAALSHLAWSDGLADSPVSTKSDALFSRPFSGPLPSQVDPGGTGRSVLPMCVPGLVVLSHVRVWGPSLMSDLRQSQPLLMIAAPRISARLSLTLANSARDTVQVLRSNRYV